MNQTFLVTMGMKKKMRKEGRERERKKRKKGKKGRKRERKNQTIVDFLKIHCPNSAFFGDSFTNIWTPQKSFLCEERKGRRKESFF